MYIIPQTEFAMYSGVPFDREHRNIIKFNYISAQSQFFAGKLVKTFNKFSYVRNNSVVKVPDTADKLYQCNYCSFLNAAFGNRRFYAFITNIEYVANDVTAISIEIDWVQTFITEWKPGICYVEREHVTDDTVGRHTVPENLEVGEYVVKQQLVYNSGVGIIGYFLEDAGSLNNGVYSATSVFTARDASTMNGWVEKYEETPEKVVMICMCPGDLVSGLNPSAVSKSLEFLGRDHTFTFAGESYVARNNKLLSFPYKFITIDNFNGNVETIKWENFNAQSSPQSVLFQLNESPTPKPCMELFPIAYQGVQQASDAGVAYDNFPQCAYNVDTFKAWISQAVPQAIVNTGTSVAVGVLAGGAVGAAAGLLSSTANFALEYRNKKIHSDSMGGSIASAGMNFAQGRVGFRIQEHTIKPEYAKIIDDFFDRFGYKVDRYKVPNISGHEEFNYVKCVESVCEGNVPQECIEQVESMLNAGVTIYHSDF